MGMALILALGSVVRVKLLVSLRVYVMIVFCRTIVLLPVFYAFRICIPHSAILHYTSTLKFRHSCDVAVYRINIVLRSYRRIQCQIVFGSLVGNSCIVFKAAKCKHCKKSACIVNKTLTLTTHWSYLDVGVWHNALGTWRMILSLFKNNTYREPSSTLFYHHKM